MGHDVIIAKRVSEGIQKIDRPEASRFIDLAEELGLGKGKRENIEILDVEML